MIFHIHVTFKDMPAGIGNCAHKLEITVPVVLPEEIKYVPWNAKSHIEHLTLNYDSLNIPSPLNLNKSTIKMLDRTYKMLDSQLAKQLTIVNRKINKIKDARLVTEAEICAYVGVALAALNTVVLMLMFCRWYRLNPTTQLFKKTKRNQSPNETIALEVIQCADCDKPIDRV